MKFASLQIGDWLTKSLTPNCLATITFRQCKHHGSGVKEWINQDIALTTCNELLLRCTKKTKLYTNKGDHQSPRWATFVEDGNGCKRMHAHITLHIPSEIPFEIFDKNFRELCERFDWVDERIDIQQLKSDEDSRRAIFYCLKEGADAFQPNASRLVSN